MNATEKLKKGGLGVRLFVALMLVSALGVLFKYPVLLVLEIFFGRAAEYTSTHYSYKPGQSGNSIEFFVLNDDGLYVTINTIASILISFLFYVGFFSAFATIINLRSRNSKAARRDFIITTVIFGLFMLPRLTSSIDSVFALNRQTPYVVKDRIYDSQNNTWELGMQRFIGHKITDHVAKGADSSLLLITKITDNDKELILRDKVASNVFGGEYRLFGDTLWVFDENYNYAKVFNTTTNEILVNHPNELLSFVSYPGNSEVNSLRTSSCCGRENCLYLTMKDGRELYLMMTEGAILDKEPYIREDRKYYLKNLNSNQLQFASYDRDELTAAWGKRVFLDAEILLYNDDLVIIRHKPDMNEDSQYLVGAYSIDNAQELWLINEAEIDFLGKIYGSLTVEAYFVGDEVKVNYKDAFSFRGTINIDAQGKASTNDENYDFMRL
ncbi:hypothetical protein LVD15_14215 [Fulvivirga maritima]|uniref:hypothetical protein n=1 Tax=Fulvivirga maritima TaxID=2904247 RepID=UPI001F1ADFE5|nr:hypothetical protein [Fulvivirga maritima]UII24477.1 hypothetical protein LVD15_14215 [Fulvivirga maritima]